MKSVAGSMTLEAAMVLPVVIIVLIGMLGLGFMQYQQSYLQVQADRIARERSYDYGENASHMYWRFSQYNKEEILIPAVMGSEEIEGEVQVLRQGMRTMIRVTLQEDFSFAGIIDTKLLAVGQARVKDTEESIRTIQLLDDTLNNFGIYQMFKDGWRTYLEQLLDLLH